MSEMIREEIELVQATANIRFLRNTHLFVVSICHRVVVGNYPWFVRVLWNLACQTVLYIYQRLIQREISRLIEAAVFLLADFI